MAKKAVRKTATGTAKSTKNRASSKRDLVKRRSVSAYAKRTAGGRFREMDAVGRSQAADRRKTAKKTVTSGYGDQGDQRKRRRS